MKAAPSWRHYLKGLWFSGLRLTESLNLFWNDGDGEYFDDRLCVDLTGKRPLLIIPGGEEKGNKDRLLPIAPEFAEFLLQIPKEEQIGRVFNPKNTRTSMLPTPDRVGKLCSRIGKAAGVVVNRTKKPGKDGKTITKVKYASAHDLRRSFGQRWAARVMPQILMQLLRHESIDTTIILRRP